MKKYIIHYIASISMITVLLGTSLNSYAQDKKQEFSIAVGGPFSFLQYNTPGEIVNGNGFNAGLRYAYYLSETISINLGVEYQTYRSTSKFGAINGQYNAVDDENESFQFRYKGTNFREDQKLGYVNIPIGIQFETPGTTQLYLAAGAKVGFATTGTYETTMSNLTTSGYYPQYNVELFSPAFAGFASTNNFKTAKQDLTTEVAYSATFETGLKQSLGDRNSVYIGLYLDYGLNNIYDKASDKNLVQYNAEQPVQLDYNTVLSSSYANDVRLVSYGLKLRFAFR
ncbi:porin family protein [Flavobacterium geliluteum]|uniref:Outer membrane protein beta-barrel domain-containing protein n=1 Tax=Flavobacterium geliluteum TaxID=2816120 RepID=A0A940X5F3_9FLAO|nr:hypothetical protein [Flavobacterium geliluteum]MBP4136699.1 hypothetical protein [Flavobacterium geliluteum]